MLEQVRISAQRLCPHGPVTSHHQLSLQSKYERSGATIRQLLIRSNPWGQGHCGRPEGECPTCDTGDGKQRCQQRSVGYESSCTVCKQRADRDRQLGTEDTENKARYSIYVGETSLTLRERMVGVRGQGARRGGHLNNMRKASRRAT